MFQPMIPIALFNLLENKAYLLASVAGVGSAVVLMFVELGFQNGIYDSQTHVLRAFNADALIVHRYRDAVMPSRPFSRLRISQALSVRGVDAVYPIYLKEFVPWKNRVNGQAYPILVYAFDPLDPAFLDPDIVAQSKRLLLPNTALIDVRSGDYYGPLTVGAEGELNGRLLRVVGEFAWGPNFREDGNLIVSDRTFFNCFHDPKTRKPEKDRVDFGLVKIAPGEDLSAVCLALREHLPPDVVIYTKAEFIEIVIRFWRDVKAVGRVFDMGVVVGFAIGIAVCYQILYSTVLDRLAQYATLNAIGYTNRFLASIVVQEALLLSLLGFIPGVLLALVIYRLLELRTGLIMNLTLLRTMPVFVATVVMCTLGGLAAAVKVMRTSPALLFDE